MRSFSNWVESEENPSLAGPQHKRREKNSSLDDIVDEIVEELVRTKKGNRQQILNSLKNYLEKNGADQVPSQSQTQQGLESPGQENQGVVNV